MKFIRAVAKYAIYDNFELRVRCEGKVRGYGARVRCEGKVRG